MLVLSGADPGDDFALGGGRYFPVVTDERRLPVAISEWLLTGASEPFAISQGFGRLIVRSPSNSERRILLLSEEGRLTALGNPPLTPREAEVLRWLTEGKSNCEIAIILGVAMGTVKLHVQHILEKLGVSNRTAAAALVRQSGMRI